MRLVVEAFTIISLGAAVILQGRRIDRLENGLGLQQRVAYRARERNEARFDELGLAVGRVDDRVTTLDQATDICVTGLSTRIEVHEATVARAAQRLDSAAQRKTDAVANQPIGMGG